ncbi:MAG TPA: adenylate/guanylate cyclase domain-containing protein, partial [Polyangiaceae bacterium]|nr:adenylate/guanylate cyclase domain-containing protein [Polyangiaceae bacterium]
MATYSGPEAADRAGISVEMLTRIVELGAVELPSTESFSESDVRKIALIRDFVEGGLPLEGLATQIKTGRLTLSFLDSASSDLFAAMSSTTFEQLSATTGIPLQTLMVIREAAGSSIPDPTDLVRENEMALIPYVQAQLASGYPSDAVERGLRTMGEALRRFATSEVERFEAFIIAPVARRPGSTGADISAAVSAAIEGMSGTRLKAVGAAFRGQQAAAFSAGIMDGFARDLEAAGLLETVDRPPAICFLDVTGYTRHTAERGDQAAADLAHDLSRLVQRSALKYGGRPVKWLGDGVMLWFREPGPAVIAALEMAKGVENAGLPPAHVGLHAGPVVMQDGDYYGQTVNLSSRIAGYARAGEVVVSQAVVDAAAQAPVEFQDLGDVELKGLA